MWYVFYSVLVNTVSLPLPRHHCPPFQWIWPISNFPAWVDKCFLWRPDGKENGLWGLDSFVATIQPCLCRGNSTRQYRNNCIWVSSNKGLIQKMSWWLDVAHVLKFEDVCFIKFLTICLWELYCVLWAAQISQPPAWEHSFPTLYSAFWW